jgi:hypothetical protein
VYKKYKIVRKREINEGTIITSRNFKKLVPEALPTKIFGGSPIIVAVPPILAAKIIGNKKVSGFISIS